MRGSFRLCIVVVVAIGLVACRGKGATEGPLKIGIFTWVGYTPLYIAQEKGYFKKHGVEVEIVRIEDGSARRAALASGDLSLSAAVLDEFAMASAAGGLKAKVILKLDDSMGADGILVRDGINSVADLKGKTVAFPQGLPSHYFLLNILEEAGLSPDDIEVVYMEAGQAGAAFLAGNVDAAVTWEPWLSKARASKTGSVLMTSKEKPGLIVDVLLASTKVIEERPGDLEKIAAAWFEALDFIHNSPDEAYEIMAKAINISRGEFELMVQGLTYASLAENKDYFSAADGPARVEQDLLRANAVWRRYGVSKKEIVPASLFYTKPLDSLEN